MSTMIPLEFRADHRTCIQRCEIVEGRSSCIIIMGPTGSGKSSFIEALAGEDQSLDLSNGGLSGFTQDVTAYEVDKATLLLGSPRNDKELWPTYLIDTPGFCDREISEVEIITKVNNWMSDNNMGYIGNILYLCPITDTRVSGSKRRTIELFQSLLQKSSAKRLMIVTTMWDRLGNTRAEEQAELHFSQLREDIWKDLVDSGAQVERFHNTYDSALSIIKAALESYGGDAPLRRSEITSSHPSAPFLYPELVDRIENALQEKELSHQDQIGLIARPDSLLEPMVIRQRKQAAQNFAKSLEELVALGPPPQGLGFEGVTEWYVYQDLLVQVKEAQKEVKAINLAIGRLHVEPDPERESVLQGQLERIKHSLASHLERVDKYGKPPKIPRILAPMAIDQPETKARYPSWKNIRDGSRKGFTYLKDMFSVRFKWESLREIQATKAPIAESLADHEAYLDLQDLVNKDREESRALQFYLASIMDRMDHQGGERATEREIERVPILESQLEQVETRLAERLKKLEQYHSLPPQTVVHHGVLASVASQRGSVSSRGTGIFQRFLNRVPQEQA